LITNKYLIKDSTFSRNSTSNSIKKNKLAIFIAIILSSLTTLIIFRNFFFSQGIVNIGDLQWPYYSEQLSAYVWYEYGQFSLLPSQMILYSWLWNLNLSPELLERIMYFSIYTLMGFSAFFVTFKLIMKDKTNFHFFLAGIASVVYMLNPINVYYSPHIFLLIGYALFPLIIYIAFRYWQRRTNKSQILKYAIVLAFLFTLISGDPRWIIFSIFSFLFIHTMLFITHGGKGEKWKFFGLIIWLLPIFFILNLFWIFPLINSYFAGVELTSLSILTKESYYMLNAHTSIINSLRFQADFWMPTRELFIPENIYAFSIWAFSGLILPIFAFSASVLRYKKKEIFSLTMLSLLIILIATAPLSPIELVDKLYAHFIFNIPSGVMFRTSYKWLLLLSFPIVLLSTFSLSGLFFKLKRRGNKKFNKKISVVIISFLSVILLISSAVNSWPLLTGDISDSFEPKVLNEEYEKIYEILQSNYSNDSFKIVFWPKSPNWRAPVPIVKDSLYINYLRKSVEDNKVDDLGSRLAPLNVRYLIFDGRTQDEIKLYNGLLKQNDVREIYQKENLSLFEIENPKMIIRPVNTICSSEGFSKIQSNINNSAWFFHDQSLDFEKEIVEQCRLLFGDILFNYLWNAKIISPFSFTQFHNPSKYWSKAATNDPLHAPWHTYLEKRNIENWDFDYGMGLVFTWSTSFLDEPFFLGDEDVYQAFDFENNNIIWNINAQNTQKMFLSDESHHGTKSLVVELNASSWGWKTISSPLIPATYGSQYKWEFYVKGKDAYEVHAKVIEYNETEELIESHHTMGIGSSDFDWKKIFFNFIPTSPDTKYMQLQLWHGHETNQTLPNKIWIDDVRIYNLSDYLIPNSLEIPFNVEKDGSYELFIRYFQNKDGGKIVLQLDRNLLATIETEDQLNKFTCSHLETLDLKRGSHTLTLENMEGFNAVNIFALIPSDEYKNIEMEIYDLLEDKRVIYIFEAETDLYRKNTEVLNAGGRASNGELLQLQADSKIWRNIEIQKEGSYAVALRLNGSALIKIDNQTFAANSTHLDFTYFGLHLEQGQHEIEILPGRHQSITWTFDKAENSFEEWKENTLESPIYSLSLDKENETSCLKAELYNSTWGWKLINSPLMPISSNKEYLWEFEIKGENVHAAHAKVVEYNKSKNIIKSTYLSSIGDGTFDWKNVSFSFKPTSTNTSYMQLQIWHGHNTSQPLPNRIWLDNVRTYRCPSSQIDVLWIYSTEENETIDDLFSSKETPAKIITYEKVDPTKYIMTINATSPFMLSFAESYDPLWVAYVERH
jgi:hypothetical protein